MVLCLDRMCQCGLHAVLWSHIGSLMRFLAAEPRSATVPLFTSQCPSGTILLTLYSMVWDWRVSRAGPMVFYWPKLLYPYTIVFYYFSLSFFPVYRLVLWGWGLRTEDPSHSLSLTLPTFFNNTTTTNNNKNVFPSE